MEISKGRQWTILFKGTGSYQKYNQPQFNKHELQRKATTLFKILNFVVNRNKSLE